MRVLVCGGRSFDNEVAVYGYLDKLHAFHKFTLVIHGAARGADTLADNWAYSRHIDVVKFPADWKQHKRAAGPLRNAQMLAEGKPELVVAFPGGNGTANMKQTAHAAGVRVIDLASDTVRALVTAQWKAISQKGTSEDGLSQADRASTSRPTTTAPAQPTGYPTSEASGRSES